MPLTLVLLIEVNLLKISLLALILQRIHYFGKVFAFPKYFPFICEMKIGNIVSNNKIEVSEDFNVVDSFDEIIEGLPTLIIGWDYLNKNFSDYDVLTRKVTDNISWTFKKSENRTLFESDLYFFVYNTYHSLFNKIDYIFIDPILFSRRKIKKIIGKILSIDVLYSYQYNNMIYIYGDKLVFGIDLSLLEFIDIKKEKILSKIKEIVTIFLADDKLFIEYKKNIGEFDNYVRYVPYLYSIKNG